MFELFLVYLWLKIFTINNFLIGISVFGFLLVIAMMSIFDADREKAEEIVDAIDRKIISDRVGNSKRQWATEFKNNLVENTKIVKTRSNRILSIAVISFLIFLIAPTREQLSILIVSGYAISAIHSPEVEKIIVLARGVSNKWLDEQIGKLKTKE